MSRRDNGACGHVIEVVLSSLNKYYHSELLELTGNVRQSLLVCNAECLSLFWPFNHGLGVLIIATGSASTATGDIPGIGTSA